MIVQLRQPVDLWPCPRYVRFVLLYVYVVVHLPYSSPYDLLVDLPHLLVCCIRDNLVGRVRDVGPVGARLQ